MRIQNWSGPIAYASLIDQDKSLLLVMEKKEACRSDLLVSRSLVINQHFTRRNQKESDDTISVSWHSQTYWEFLNEKLTDLNHLTNQMIKYRIVFDGRIEERYIHIRLYYLRFYHEDLFICFFKQILQAIYLADNKISSTMQTRLQKQDQRIKFSWFWTFIIFHSNFTEIKLG